MALPDGPLPIVLSERERDALAAAIRRFPKTTQERGRRYVREGRVGEIEVEGIWLTAIVVGNDEYLAEWSLEGGRWRGSCSCPVGERCKHLFALGEEVLAQSVTRGAGPGRAPARELPARTPPSLVERILTATRGERVDRIASEIASRVPGAAQVPLPDLMAALFENDAELRVWRVARALEQGGAGPIPDELERFVRRDDLARRDAQRRAAELLAALESWSEQAAAAPRKRLRFELRLAADSGGGRTHHSLSVRVRLSSSRIADEPRSGHQVVALLREADTRPGVLAPAERELARFLLDGGYFDSLPYEYSNRFGSDEALLARAAATPLVRIADDLAPGVAARTGLVPGGPVVLDPGPARLEPVVEPGERGPELCMCCVLPNGERVGMDRVWLAREQAALLWRDNAANLLATRGRFFHVRDAPPPALLELSRRVGPIALGGAELGRVRRIAARMPVLAESLAPFVSTLRVTPLLLLDLVEPDVLDARLVAHTGPREWQPPQAPPEGTRLFEADALGVWRERDASFAEVSPCAGAPQLVEPDPSDVAAAARWLESLDPSASGDPGAGLPPARYRSMRASAARFEALSHAVDAARREGLGVYASARLAKLLRRGVARVRTSVRASGVDFFEIDATWTDELEALTDEDRRRLRASSERFVRLRSGWVRREPADEDDAVLDALADLGVAPGDGARRIGLLELAGARAESLSALERLAGGEPALEQVRRLRERVASFKGLPRVAPPRALCAELRPYQQAGLDFLAWVSSLGLGAVLADDMGLGKTVQALAWLLHLREREPEGGPSLVVCPTSVVHGWAREAARFAPELRVLVLERGGERAARRRELARCDLALTSYALLRRDLAEWREVPLRAAILDEAQQVKNPDAAVSRAVRELRARHRLVLTGTPLENRPLDLWSVSEFANPGHLGSRPEFLRRFDRADAPPHARRLLAARLRPVLLRRLKRDVAPELPERIEERRDCELSPEQRKRYAVELERARRVAAAPAESAQAGAQKRIAILAALLRLRQIACHPALAGGSPGQRSGKLEALLELIEPLVAEGHKVLVFSQFVRFLELVAPELARREIRSHMLTGATTRRERVIGAFRSDPEPCVFLISLKAGGAGLNLTEARYVVLLDPWWNPAVEAQAIDRTHRIGQDSTVVAYRLVARGTIEEKVLALQQAKQALVQDVLGDEAFARSLSREDLEQLFSD